MDLCISIGSFYIINIYLVICILNVIILMVKPTLFQKDKHRIIYKLS